MKQLIIILLLSFSGYSQFTQIPTGTNLSIFELSVKDDYVLLGGSPYLANCTGDCDSVNIMSTPTLAGHSQRGSQVLDSNHLYLSSHQNGGQYQTIIFGSSDGGQNWNQLIDTTGSPYNDLFVFDTSSISIIHKFYTSFYTLDGGITWGDSDHNLIISSASCKVNDSTSILGTTSSIRYTKNKGQTWSSNSFVQSAPRAFFANSLDSIYAVSYGGNGVFFSYAFNIETGGNWVHKFMPGWSPYDIYVKSINEIYVVGSWFVSNSICRILKTTDLGNTWSYIDPVIFGELYDIEFLNDSIALISGSNGLLLKWNSNSPVTGILSLSELNQVPKHRVKITDLMGRETEDQPNTPLIYIYSDGTTEKVFRVE